MSVQVWGMMEAGVAALVAGLILVWARFREASSVGRALVLGPVFEATALAVFAAEHFVAWRHVRWAAALLALLFLIIVATIDLPKVRTHLHERLFWTLTLREMAFAGGAMVLAGSMWPRGSSAGSMLVRVGRVIVALTMVFYRVQHLLFPRFVPGVPLSKLMPVWVPAPTLIAWFIGITLLLAGIGLLVPSSIRIAAASSGMVLLLLTVFFYVPILAMEIHSSLAVEGINYVADTLLFAATALLAGFGADQPRTAAL